MQGDATQRMLAVNEVDSVCMGSRIGLAIIASLMVWLQKNSEVSQ